MHDFHRRVIQVLPELSAALRLAANRDLQTVSEYVRRAVIERLRADGIDPAASALQSGRSAA
jgi:hypothetical protein